MFPIPSYRPWSNKAGTLSCPISCGPARQVPHPLPPAVVLSRPLRLWSCKSSYYLLLFFYDGLCFVHSHNCAVTCVLIPVFPVFLVSDIYVCTANHVFIPVRDTLLQADGTLSNARPTQDCFVFVFFTTTQKVCNLPSMLLRVGGVNIYILCSCI